MSLDGRQEAVVSQHSSVAPMIRAARSSLGNARYQGAFFGRSRHCGIV